MNDKKLIQRCCPLLAAALAQFAVPAARSDELQATVTLTSNYFWRGYSKSDEQASAQINVDYSRFAVDSGYFAGAWLSSVDFGDQAQATDTKVELILYGGWTRTLNDDFSFDLQLSHYLYDADLFDERADYSEFYAFLHFRDLVTAEIAFAPDAYATGESTVNGQLTFRYPLTNLLDLSAGVGYHAAREVFAYDYRYWNAGISWRASRFSLDLRHFSARETNAKLTYPDYLPYGQARAYRQRELPFSESAIVLTLATGF